MQKCRWLLCLLAIGLCLLPVPAQADGLALINGRITADQFKVAYTISGTAGETITARMTRTSGNLEPFLALWQLGDPDTILARSVLDETSREAIMNYTFETSGSYEIAATRFLVEEGTTTGDYILEITGTRLVSEGYTRYGEPPMYTDPAIILSAPQSINGVITNELFATYYFVYADAGQSLAFRMSRVEGDLQPALVLLNPDDATVVARGSLDEAESTLEFVNNSLPNWYVLGATRFDVEVGQTQGEYQLSFEAGYSE